MADNRPNKQGQDFTVKYLVLILLGLACVMLSLSGLAIMLSTR